MPINQIALIADFVGLKKMEYILRFKELEKYFEKADFTDVKVFEGNTTLRRFRFLAVSSG